MTERLNTPVYLRSDVQAEPLVAGWHAWSHILAPHTGSLALVNAHLRSMESFVAAPSIHAAALRNPKMRGGPFLALPESAAPQVRALYEHTRDVRARSCELGEAIKQLHVRLSSSASGGSLESLYNNVPGPLRGRVELVYDTAHQPNVRYLEPLLYRSEYHNADVQAIELSDGRAVKRAFIFSTPRLTSHEGLRAAIPFSRPELDDLFRMREHARPLGEVVERLGLDADRASRLHGLCAESSTYRGHRYHGEGVRVRNFGHACVLIESRAVSVLVDPLVCYGGRIEDSPHLDLDDLPPTIDYVLITHGHADHLSLETLLQLRHKIGTVLVPCSGGGFLEDPSLRLMLMNLGFPRVRELGDLESIEVDGGSLTALPFLGEHGDLNVRSKAAWSVRLDGRQVVLAADSCNLAPELYRWIADAIGPVDLLFVGLECDGAPVSWNYGHLMMRPLARDKDSTRRLSSSDAHRALGIVDALAPARTVVYAMGLEPWLDYITSISFEPDARPLVEARRFVETCRARGIPADQFFSLKEISL
jgi:L-ascorbate metabolism protein UlaG (beta-lactamase superfamily)